MRFIVHEDGESCGQITADTREQPPKITRVMRNYIGVNP